MAFYLQTTVAPYLEELVTRLEHTAITCVSKHREGLVAHRLEEGHIVLFEALCRLGLHEFGQLLLNKVCVYDSDAAKSSGTATDMQNSMS